MTGFNVSVRKSLVPSWAHMINHIKTWEGFCSRFDQVWLRFKLALKKIEGKACSRWFGFKLTQDQVHCILIACRYVLYIYVKTFGNAKICPGDGKHRIEVEGKRVKKRFKTTLRFFFAKGGLIRIVQNHMVQNSPTVNFPPREGDLGGRKQMPRVLALWCCALCMSKKDPVHCILARVQNCPMALGILHDSMFRKNCPAVCSTSTRWIDTKRA